MIEQLLILNVINCQLSLVLKVQN